jgi:serine protease inhibitor
MQASHVAAALVCFLGLGVATHVNAVEPKKEAKATKATKAPAAQKDIVLDQAPSAAASSPPAAAGSRLVPRPAAPVATLERSTTDVHRAALAGHVAELGLNLLRVAPAGSNAVVSPASVTLALAMLQAGVAAQDGREIAQLFGSSLQGANQLQQHLPYVLERVLGKSQSGTASGLALASRLWVHQGMAASLQAPYVAAMEKRFQASGAVLDFAKAEPARSAINQWVGERTAGRIPDLLAPGSITPTTRLVLTQATHFRGGWVQPFAPANTRAAGFEIAPGQTKQVATLHGEVKVRAAQFGGLHVIELPFEGTDIVAQIALPPVGMPLASALNQLDGLDLAGWSTALKPQTCRMQLPKLALKPAAQSLKAALQSLGVNRVFGSEASFAPALGAAGAKLQLDELFHGATLQLDEHGAEAAAATAAVIGVKSLDLRPVQDCIVDRPFLLLLVHKPTLLPFFVARVQDPSQP